ncbi:uncharacterized protein LOC124309218 [Neodiprion virginianus]|uniref:uncharacterized protein LOC124309218 n=1 Tax=Neodiprion virginianus TaxID=2961670 RepID=UPI001EE6C48D|nr:uncharacterized protein LOC124309218 [Neodiprion virginianus]
MINAKSTVNGVAVIAALLSVLAEGSPIGKSDEGCSILINGGLAEPQPLILRPGFEGGYVIPEETGSGSVTLAVGESLRLVCLGNSFDLETSEPVEDANVTCVGGTTFTFEGLGITEEFENIGCLSYPTHTARRTGVACPNGEVCEIGFDLGDGDFQRLITLCHDDVDQNTILAHAKVPAVIDAAQTSFPRPGFVKGDFYVGVSMANIYTRVNQRATLARIIGSEELALEYLPASGTYYWAKGHLVAKTDLIYGAHQRSTFYYLNTVPMWQNINAGNWGIVEANLKNLATNRDVDLDVWTGSTGVLTLADVNGDQQEIHLYVDENNNRAVPVPKLLFKVVWEESSGLGVAFVTVNNPYLEELDDEHVICTDVCDQVSYLTWNPTRSDRGLSYCCEVDDFRKAFPDIPEFTTTGILA